MLLLTLFILLFALIMLGMEIAWAIGVACLAYMVLAEYFGDGVPFLMLPQQTLEGIDSFSLIAVPLFIFAGELMALTGVTDRLIRLASAFIGHIRGGLANVAVVSNFVLSGVSGSALADAAATGSVVIPQMKQRGYPVDFACAVVAASSMVGPIIPPSITFVLLASVVNISVGRLFLAGVIPGILMSASMLALTYYIARKRGYPVEPRASWRERASSIVHAVLPLLAPLIILRSITTGVATPTEAAALLVAYVMFLGFAVYRTLTLGGLMRAASRAMQMTAIIMLTVGLANMFSWLAILEDFGGILTSAMLAISTNPYVLLFLLNVLLALLGTFMEPLPIILVLGPIIFPMFTGMGVDPIHLGVVVVINLVLGMITPPVGLVVNITAVIGGTNLGGPFREILPYFVLLCFVLLAVTYIPALSMWLPNLLMQP